ncbi:metallophosphoesterase family protein [Neobacillus vireti]|uniref:Ser/Thr protein phosphatase family protein n=1 Tax=Neobacillus vireti LMG 21834 TaxID=1131730 RepID=A0AB94IPT0_9BACI|nr:metallophosphoesterase [Neobacillus vireti]ETI68973.1 Ser/Thr protein phosphatase family protein [Neobacillus vireti LMG 21834]
MKIFYAGDLHGGETAFRKFTNAGKFYIADLVIYGGDFTGKMVVPIVEKSGIYTCRYYGSTVKVKKVNELPDLERNLRDAGFYPYLVSEKELNQLNESDAERIIKEKQIEVFRQWIEMADERFKAAEIPCIMIPGSVDDFYLDEFLNAGSFVQNGDEKIIEIDGFEILSIGGGKPSVFKYPREYSEEELAKKIENAAKQVKDMNKCIFNIHIPPYDTDLDQGTLYDEELKPVLDGDSLATAPIGSKAVRDAIEKYQPMLSLHGHVHESRGVTTLGRTICINAGTDYDQGLLRGALVDVSADGNVSYTLTAG